MGPSSPTGPLQSSVSHHTLPIRHNLTPLTAPDMTNEDRVRPSCRVTSDGGGQGAVSATIAAITWSRLSQKQLSDRIGFTRGSEKVNIGSAICNLQRWKVSEWVGVGGKKSRIDRQRKMPHAVCICNTAPSTPPPRSSLTCYTRDVERNRF